MREIKFRAWDGEQMSDPFGLGDLHDGLVYQDDEAYDIESKEIMQYTGLNDKNGTEIYEGDILDEKYRFVVKWLDDGFVADNGMEIRRVISLLSLRSQAGCPSEVIGNIYENPELLEDK